MDTTMRELERKSHSDPQMRRRYEHALNRLITSGDLDVLYAYHQARLETQEKQHPTISAERFEHPFTSAEQWWNANDMSRHLAAGNRINADNNPLACIWREYMGRNCTDTSEVDYCANCMVNDRHMRATVRLILAREPAEPTFVSFDEMIHSTDTQMSEFCWACEYEECIIQHEWVRESIRVWSELRGTYVMRDPMVDWWNANDTLEYQMGRKSRRGCYWEDD